MRPQRDNKNKRMQDNGNKKQEKIKRNGKALVVFGANFNVNILGDKRLDVVVADSIHKNDIENLGYTFVDIGTLVGLSSIEEANIFLDELSSATFPGVGKVSKSFVFEGYELWWVHYNDFFHYFSLPFTQYKILLEYLRNFENITFYNPPFKNLFIHYLRAYGCGVSFLDKKYFKKVLNIPFGIFVQIFITTFSVLILMITRPRVLVFTGDSLEPSRDYDFRMKFIYEELRNKKLSFVEFIRSLESWKTVIKHAVIRRRPVIYSEAVAFMGKIMSLLTFERYGVSQGITKGDHSVLESPEDRFRFAIAIHYLEGVYADIWTIRIMRLIESIIGVRVAFIAAVNERNFSTFLGCKMNNIPTVGILHGVAFRYVTPYDFMEGFDGQKMLSVDVYGVWSEWWREYYIKYSKAYKPEQLYVSGPMRPLGVLEKSNMPIIAHQGLRRVLFVSEQVAVPSEVMPYLRELIDRRDIELTIKFRPSRDGFEEWLLSHEPQILKLEHVRIAREGMQDAIQNADVVIGSYSTGVLEALLQLKVPIFFRTQKWGDYFSMSEHEDTKYFFAENPYELSEKIDNSGALPNNLLAELRERYFGDPHENGSKWVVDKLEEMLKENH